jgi:hypothetical protein
MPDIFISNDNAEEKKGGRYSLPEERHVALHEKEILRDRRKNKQEMAKESNANPSELGKSTVITSPIGIFSAFKIRPKGVRYHEQDDDEHVLLILRKHFITNAPWIIFGAFLLILLPILFYIFHYTSFPINFSISIQAEIVLVYAYYLMVFCYLFVSYFTWYYNADLITDKKIVDINFQDIIYHDVSMTKIDLVEDVNYVQSGFFGSMFGFGDVFIETAGKTLKFDFKSVPHPERVVNLLEDLIGGSSIAE